MDLPGEPFWVSAASRVIRTLPAGRYRAMNWIARRQVPAFWAALPDDFGRLVFRCDLRDPLMREVCITGRYEPQETMLMQRLLGFGMTFVDVGANWGYFTLGGAFLVGARGRVLSVEADSAAARTLTANVERNQLAWVTVIAAAASDRPETIRVRRYAAASDESSNFGVAFVAALDDRETSGASSLEIPAKPLDAILDDHAVAHVDLLKMDIEGAESRALTGLSTHLRREAIDRLIVELHPAHLENQGTTPGAIVDVMTSFGYSAWRIDHSPTAHRRAASMQLPVDSLLTPLTAGAELGKWPHVLFARRGLTALGLPR